MMRLNEFPTEDELKVMVAEVDQVGTIEEKNSFLLMQRQTLFCNVHIYRYEVSSKANAKHKRLILPCHLLKPPREGVLRSSSLVTLGPLVLMSSTEARGSS
jgi:hypothetical protein